MNFAKKELEKYGWKEGQGLGKDEDGINKALKPSLKFDTSGVGYDHGVEYTNAWWEQAYNTAASNISVNVSTNDKKTRNNCDYVERTNNLLQNIKYAHYTTSFIKTSTLTGAKVIDCCTKAGSAVAVKKIQPASDDKLFAACEGRTGHKTARHGLTLSGKLTRIDKQERMLLKQLKRVSLTDKDNTKSDNNKNLDKKLKKLNSLKKLKKKTAMTDDSDDSYNPFATGCSTPKRIKNKKERKRVSFNETIIEYQSQDVPGDVQNPDIDSSSQSDASSRPPTPLITIKKDKEQDISETPRVNFEEQAEADVKNKSINDFQEKIRQENRRMKRHLRRMGKLEKGEKKNKTDGSVVLGPVVLDKIKASKRKSKHDADVDRSKNKPVVLDQDVKFHSQPKQRKLQFVTEHEQSSRSQYLSNRINNVADILTNSCKISDH